jgi:imidazolonepropionase-like amidohydrolase
MNVRNRIENHFGEGKVTTIRKVTLWLAMLTLVMAHGASNVWADEILIQAGTILAIPGKPPEGPGTLLVREGRIIGHQDGFVGAAAFALDDASVRIVDLRDSFLLPGLMDTHVHLTSSSGPDEGRDVELTSADLALRALLNARTNLAAGFTTIMDMGTGHRAHELAIYALRDAINEGRIEGPAILTAGSPISAPGYSRTTTYRNEVDAVIGPEGVCSGADDCRRAVREQVKRGADFINVYNTGSLLSARTVPQTFTDDELAAIVDTAHSLGRKVIADGAGAANSAAGLNAALRAGVDALDTAMFPDDETIRLLEQTGAFYIPHLYALQAAVGDTPETLEQGTMGWLPQPLLEQLFVLKGQRPAAVRILGRPVRFVVASDPGVFPHGLNALELVEYVRIGMTPMAAIVAATRHPSELFGLADRGTLEPGKVADMIAVRGNPLEDISELTRVDFVMRNGRISN